MKSIRNDPRYSFILAFTLIVLWVTFSESIGSFFHCGQMLLVDCEELLRYIQEKNCSKTLKEVTLKICQSMKSKEEREQCVHNICKFDHQLNFRNSIVNETGNLMRSYSYKFRNVELNEIFLCSGCYFCCYKSFMAEKQNK